MTRNEKLLAAAAAAVGVGSILYYVSSRSSAQIPASKRPVKVPIVPVQYVPGDKTIELSGGWRLLDVSNLQSALGKTWLNSGGLKPGVTVTLVLDAGGGPVTYLATIAGGGGAGVYPASWSVTAPPGGPQLVDFSAEHVLV
ncbi:MAG: hypothetical protein KGK07_15975 [Chloroflexota bacterium]|nr:hypothetical protein [Chloroflexota bacterium]